jgi:hypothetical protein
MNQNVQSIFTLAQKTSQELLPKVAQGAIGQHRLQIGVLGPPKNSQGCSAISGLPLEVL